MEQQGIHDSIGIIFSGNIELSELEVFCDIISQEYHNKLENMDIYILDSINYSKDVYETLYKYFRSTHASKSIDEMINTYFLSNLIFLGDLLDEEIMNIYNEAIKITDDSVMIDQFVLDNNEQDGEEE